MVKSYNTEDTLQNIYNYGKEELLIKTIDENFKIRLDDYVTIDKLALIKIVDAISDVNIHSERLNGHEVINLLNNIKHREVHYKEHMKIQLIQAIIYKLSQTGFIKFPKIIKDTFSYVNINITPYKMLSLAFTALTLKNYEAIKLQFPMKQLSFYDKKNNLVWDKDKNIEILNDFIYKNIIP